MSPKRRVKKCSLARRRWIWYSALRLSRRCPKCLRSWRITGPTRWKKTDISRKQRASSGQAFRRKKNLPRCLKHHDSPWSAVLRLLSLFRRGVINSAPFVLCLIQGVLKSPELRQKLKLKWCPLRKKALVKSRFWDKTSMHGLT